MAGLMRLFAAQSLSIANTVMELEACHRGVIAQRWVTKEAARRLVDEAGDSSFALCGTRSAEMARWRQAIELAMTEEEIGTLTVLSRSRTEPARLI
jgi:hypothetical protein